MILRLMSGDTNALMDTLFFCYLFFFFLYLAAFALVMARLPTGRTWRALLLVVVLAALQAAVVTAAIRRREVCVPQVVGQRTLWTGVKEPFPLGLLYADLGVPHPSSYLRGTEAFMSEAV